jgi:uncharacterized protein (TIGR02302 family)
LSALVVGLSLALATSVGAGAATPGGDDCVPAEPQMGSAREALDQHNKDGGTRAQDHAIDELNHCIGDSKEKAKQALDDLNNMLSNLQMAQPGQQSDQGDEDASAELDELGNMIREQQQLRDRTFREGQDQRRRQNGQRQGQKPAPGDKNNFGDLQKNQQALRDRLKQLMDKLKQKGFGQPQQGQGDQQQNGGEPDPLGEAGGAMDEAQGSLGDRNADSAVDSQGRALEALRKGAQNLAQEMDKQMQMGQQQGNGPPRGPGRQRAQNDTDPLGRPLHGYQDGQKVPLEADVQRARRILEELRKRYGDTARSQLELDYIERLLKGY